MHVLQKRQFRGEQTGPNPTHPKDGLPEHFDNLGQPAALFSWPPAQETYSCLWAQRDKLHTGQPASVHGIGRLL